MFGFTFLFSYPHTHKVLNAMNEDKRARFYDAVGGAVSRFGFIPLHADDDDNDKTLGFNI